jgi:hypothetical protein
LGTAVYKGKIRPLSEQQNSYILEEGKQLDQLESVEDIL